MSGRLKPARCSRQYSRSAASSSVAAGSAHDRGQHPLAPLLVGHADHAGLDDVGVLVEDRLDLLGRDVLAAADDLVAGPPAEEQVAVLVEVPEVAGVDPARRRRSSRRSATCPDPQ